MSYLHPFLRNLFLFTLLYIFLQPASFAQEQKDAHSLFIESIAWENEAAKSELLKSVPTWSQTTISLLHNIYLHPINENLTELKNSNQYNLQFINEHWGPLNNPFNKYPRPAKAFVFLTEVNGKKPNTFLIAPLIQNENDGQYYVFDKTETQPVLLNTWIDHIRSEYQQLILRFNICTAYGSAPSDSCETASYQNEVNDYTNSYKNFSLTAQEAVSAARELKEPWRTKIKRPATLTGNNTNILDESVMWSSKVNNRLKAQITSWANMNVITHNFAKIRDSRYFTDTRKENFVRRISWLYPEDGCWTRASAAIKDFFGPEHNVVNQYERPAKIFVFGDLCALTNNSPKGYVSWWYHTAPIVRDAETDEIYVLDPAIEADHPLTLQEWGNRISSNVDGCRGNSSKIESYSICNGYGSNPYNTCNAASKPEVEASLLQTHYQELERSRQVALKRDVDAVLGDSPPWKK